MDWGTRILAIASLAICLCVVIAEWRGKKL